MSTVEFVPSTTSENINIFYLKRCMLLWAGVSKPNLNAYTTTSMHALKLLNVLNGCHNNNHFQKLLGRLFFYSGYLYFFDIFLQLHDNGQMNVLCKVILGAAE